MTTCVCAATDLRAVAFANGVVMHWCARHEVQRWTVDGRAVQHTDVLPVLKDLFTEERGHSRRDVAPAPKARTPARLPAAPSAPPSDEQLTALLNARGLQGSWSVG